MSIAIVRASASVALCTRPQADAFAFSCCGVAGSILATLHSTVREFARLALEGLEAPALAMDALPSLHAVPRALLRRTIAA